MAEAAVVKMDPKGKANGMEKEPFVVKAGGPGMRVRENGCNEWLCIVPNDVRPKDLTRMGLFGLVGSQLRPRDSIRVFPTDNSYFAELIVVSAGVGYAEVALIRSHDLPAPSLSDPDALLGFEFQQDGLTGWWFATRKSDGAELGRQSGLKTLKEAKRFVEDHASNRVLQR